MAVYLEPIKTALIIFPIIAFLITLPYLIIEYHKYGSVPLLRSVIVYTFVLYLLTAFFLVILPLPSLPEQQKIASFLDRKCAEIDEMIALQEKIVEELKAYKQSVITEAVTKGLNPEVPMKDSGIEWIGKIPKDWKVNRCKNISRFKKKNKFLLYYIFY